MDKNVWRKVDVKLRENIHDMDVSPGSIRRICMVEEDGSRIMVNVECRENAYEVPIA